MATATSVAVNSDTGFVVQSGTCVVDLASIAAAGEEDVSIAIPAAKVGDQLLVAPRTELTDGLVIGSTRISANGTGTVKVENHSAGAIDQASMTWDWMILRGNEGITT